MLRNIYVYTNTYIMQYHNEKMTMNLKESWKEYIGEFGGRKGDG